MTGASSQTCQLQLGCACDLQLMANSQVLTGVAPDAERIDCYTRLYEQQLASQLLSDHV